MRLVSLTVSTLIVCATWALGSASSAFAINEIAYECGGRGIDICLLDPTNPTAVTNLTDNGNASFDENPIWSPDGKKVAFVSNFVKGGTGEWNIFVMDTTATGQAVNLATQITSYSSGSKVIDDLAWSPDGSRIAYTRGNNAGDDSVWVVNADGTTTFPLEIGGPGAKRHPSWSPDSAKIAYAVVKNGPEQIYVASSQGGIGPPLANGVGHEPNWSPDGSRVAFDAYHSGGFGYVDLHVVAADGSGSPLIVVPNSFTEWTFSAWSPDSSRIAYRATNNEGKSNYRVINANGTGDHPLATPGDGDDRSVSWSADGSRVVFEHASFPATGAANLYVANADGSGIAQPLTTDAKSYDPSWRVVLSTAQTPPPHPGAERPKVVWITKRIPWTPGPPPFVAIYYCPVAHCVVTTKGEAKAGSSGRSPRPTSAGTSAKPKHGKRPRWVLVGRSKTKVPKGKSRKLKLPLNKWGIAALRRQGEMTIRVTITTRVAGRKKPFVQTHPIRLYFKKPAKKH